MQQIMAPWMTPGASEEAGIVATEKSQSSSNNKAQTKPTAEGKAERREKGGVGHHPDKAGIQFETTWVVF